MNVCVEYMELWEKRSSARSQEILPHEEGGGDADRSDRHSHHDALSAHRRHQLWRLRETRQNALIYTNDVMRSAHATIQESTLHTHTHIHIHTIVPCCVLMSPNWRIDSALVSRASVVER